jgi:hypothetical protein
MKKCKNCGINEAVKYSKYSTGEFCSRKCASGFSTKEKRSEINAKISATLKGGKHDAYIFSAEKWQMIKDKRKSTCESKLLNKDFSEISSGAMRDRVILDQDYKCNRCKLSEWLGEKITFELEHIDGNHRNNERSNLEALCPNCHSLTPTWRGRNNRRNGVRVSDEILLKAMVENGFNMCQALTTVGLAPKGGNYVRCHRLKREYSEA